MGAGNAWGAWKAYYTTNGSTWTNSTDMTLSDGVNSVSLGSIAASTTVKFKVTDGTNWKGATVMSQAKSNVVLSDVDGDDHNISFTLPTATNVTIYYTTPDEIYVVAEDYRIATIYLKASADRRVYAFDEDKVAYHGAWPGKTSDGGLVDGYYKHVINIADGKDLSLVFNNHGDGGTGGSQTMDISVGTISAENHTFYFDIGSGFYYWTIRGDFPNGDKNIYLNNNASAGNSITIPLPAASSYGFKMYDHDGSTERWFGVGSGAMQSNSTYPWKLDDSNNCGIKTTIEGDYVFAIDSWDNSKPKIIVTYPNKIYRSVANGSFGTICVPTDATIEGATLYTIKSVLTGVLVIQPVGTTLEAGKPYIFKSTSDEGQTITLGTEDFEETPEGAGDNNGLVGVYTKTNVAEGLHILSGDQIYEVGTDCYVNANRAYFDFATAGYPAPTAFREESNTTLVENIEASEKAVKFFDNGQLFILRNGVVYDATGRAVK